MANTTPIDTQTQSRRIPLDPPIDLNNRIANICDTMAAAGYQLSGTFVVATDLVLIFQLTR